MIPLNYHHLYYFWTVARSGSIAAATQRLYLSQPALSGQLGELEKFCGARLLERTHKGVALTWEGKIVFERCERIFAEGDELAAIIKNGFHEPAVLRIGVHPAVPREVVLRVLDFTRHSGKNLRTEGLGRRAEGLGRRAEGLGCRAAVFSGTLEGLCARLKRRVLDMLIVNSDCAAELGRERRARLAGELPVYFVASESIKKTIKRFPSDLTNAAMLLRTADNPVRVQVEHYLSRHRVAVRVEADSEDVDLLRRMAVEGRGVAALGALTVANDIKAGRLQTLHTTPVGITEPVWFVCDAQPRSNPAVRALTDKLMEDFSLFGKTPRVNSMLEKPKQKK
jgi:LysR family transcriptional activator of nhaA